MEWYLDKHKDELLVLPLRRISVMFSQRSCTFNC